MIDPNSLTGSDSLAFDSSDWSIGGAIDLPIVGGGSISITGGAGGGGCSGGGCPPPQPAGLNVSSLPFLLLLAVVIFVAVR